jgi:hypothetical protein
MNLTQMIVSVRQKSYFSRTRDEAIEAINSAAQRLYFWVLKEQQGWFLKWDLSLTYIAGTQEYLLQPDVERLIRIREQDPATGNWRIIHSTSFDDMSRLQSLFPSMFFGGASGNSTDSPLKYYGPYEKDDGKFYIQLEPPADKNRPLEIVYNAQYVEVTSEASYFMLPPELRDAAKDGAIAECLKPNGDDAWEAYESSMGLKRNEYLVILRQKSLTDPPKVGQYLSDEGGTDDSWPIIPGSP